MDKRQLIAQVLQHNAGNKLTPELISGIAAKIFSIIGDEKPPKNPNTKKE